MQWIVNLWCGLIGITDPLSIQIAAGMVAASCLMVVAGSLLGLLWAYVSTWWAGINT